MILSIKESIEIEFSGGTTIYEAIEDAIELSKNRYAIAFANRNAIVIVWFVFNGVKINVRHTDNKSLILQYYNRASQTGETEVGKESYQ